MPDKGTRNSNSLSRRQILKRVGVAGSVAAIAGCSGDGDGDGGDGGDGDGGGDIDVVTATPSDTPSNGTDETENSTPTDERTPAPKVDTTFRYGWNRDTSLPEANLNMLAPNASGELGWPVYARFGKSLVANPDHWVNCDVEGWEFDSGNNELRITFKDGVKWHQGGEVIDDLTGEDYAMQNHFDRLMTQANPDANEAENPTITGFDFDGKTYIAHLNPEGYNQQIVESGFPRTRIWMYRESWRDEYESLQSASTQEEMSEIRTNVIEKTITLADDPPLSGPGMLENVTTQGADFRRFEEHWAYDEVNWETQRFVKLSGSSGADYQAAVTDNIDYNNKIPGTVDDPPEHIHQMYIESGAGFGESLLINYGGGADSWFGFEGAQPGADNTAGKRQAKARQAIAWAINGPQVLRNRQGGYSSQFTSPMSKAVPGNPAEIQQTFPEVWEAVPLMVQEPDPQKAREALRASGLSQESGTWVKPNGDELVVEIESFPWSRDLVETVVTNLNNADINAEHIVQEQSVLFGNLGGGDFGLAQSWHGLSGPLSVTVPGWLTRDGSWETRYTPTTFEAPPVGEWDAEPTEEYDAVELVSTIKSTSFEEHKSQLRQLTWVWMYHVPGIPLSPNASSAAWNARHFEFPEHPPRSSGTNGRYACPGDGSVAAPVYGVGQPFRMLRRGLDRKNAPQARTE
jgi:hypothetical protein